MTQSKVFINFIVNVIATHCRVSYRVRLGTNRLIVIMATQYSHSQKEHMELYKITKFGVKRINFERLTTVQKC